MQCYICCNDDKYDMMIVESLDADTETRRLSPVSISTDTTVNLINGPQDHGWCSGYTCRERLSTFCSIIRLGRSAVTRVENVSQRSAS